MVKLAGLPTYKLAATLLCGLILFVVYLLTLAPSLTWSHYGVDGGDFATAIALKRVPHPPGYPVYLVLGQVLNFLPWGEVAWRLNLLSALSAATAAAGTGLLLWSIFEQGLLPDIGGVTPSKIAVAAIGSSLTLGFAPLFWSQALIAEVYALGVFFAVLILYLALRPTPVWLMGGVWGFSLGVQPLLVFWAPLIVWGSWRTRPKASTLLGVGISAIFSCGFTYGPLLFIQKRNPSPWVDPSSLANWWAFVSGELYHHNILSLALQDWPRRILAWLSLLARQFTPAGPLLFALGLQGLAQRSRSLAWAFGSVFIAVSLYSLGYNTSDSLVYLILVLPLAALWLGAGWIRLANWLRLEKTWAIGLLLLLPLLQVLLFWGQVDLSHERDALNWAERVVELAPPRAVLLSSQDRHTFTLWYVHDVLAWRPDTVVLDRDLWEHPPYQKLILAELELEGKDISLEQALRDSGRPVFPVELAESDRSP